VGKDKSENDLFGLLDADAGLIGIDGGEVEDFEKILKEDDAAILFHANGDLGVMVPKSLSPDDEAPRHVVLAVAALLYLSRHEEELMEWFNDNASEDFKKGMIQ
jgi:hypothetical protein